MADLRLFGATSNIVRFTLKDKTTGQGKKALTGSTSGLIISTIADNEATATVYTQAASHIQTIAVLGTYSAPSASNCRFGEVDATNNPGLYEFQIADARFAVASSRGLTISVNDAEATILDADYQIALVQFNPFDAVHLGLSALPNTACTTNASLLTSGTGTDQVSVSAGKVLLQATQSGVTIPTVTTVTNQLTAAQVATGVWQDATSGDFTTASSIGKSLYTSGNVPGAASGLFIAGSNAATSITTALTANIIGNITGNLSGSVGSVTGGVTVTTNNDKTGYTLTVTPPTAAAIATAVWTDTTGSDFTTATSPGKIIFTQLGGAFTTTSSSVFSTASLVNAPTGGTAPTVSQIATAVWQDATAGDFTTASSIGKSLYTSGVVPGAAGGLFIAGTNAATAVSITGNITGNVSGSIGSVTAAVLVDGTSPLTESYGTAGSGFTLAQGLYEIAQNVGSFAIAGTTITVTERDGTTPAETYTLDSATDPITSRVRAT